MPPATVGTPYLARLSVLGGVMLLGGWIQDFLEPVVGKGVEKDPPLPYLAVTLIESPGTPGQASMPRVMISGGSWKVMPTQQAARML